MIRMVIDFDERSGQVSVNGPIDNKLLALGLLELARKAVWEFDPTKQAGILLARGVPPAPGNGGERP
jgi:hypothetical protein